MNIARLPEWFSRDLSLPLIVAPMFLVSGIDLVVESCKNGAVGAIPSLNARTPEILDKWLWEIANRLEKPHAEGLSAAPWAVNLLVHTSNPRLLPDLEVCVRYRVPLIITASLLLPHYYCIRRAAICSRSGSRLRRACIRGCKFSGTCTQGSARGRGWVDVGMFGSWGPYGKRVAFCFCFGCA